MITLAKWHHLSRIATLRYLNNILAVLFVSDTYRCFVADMLPS
jgi:hypothetical protein